MFYEQNPTFVHTFVTLLWCLAVKPYLLICATYTATLSGPNDLNSTTCPEAMAPRPPGATYAALVSALFSYSLSHNNNNYNWLLKSSMTSPLKSFALQPCRKFNYGPEAISAKNSSLLIMATCTTI